MNATPKKFNEPQDADSKLDEEFVKAMLEIEKHYNLFNKHDKIRIEQWSKRLCQITQNSVWKQNRNNYALVLLSQIKKGSLEEPFTKVPPENSLPPLNKHIVKNRLSSATGKHSRTKTTTESSQKKSRPAIETEISEFDNDGYSENRTPHKIESVNQSQDLNWSYQKRGLETPSDGYASNKKIMREDIGRNGDQGSRNAAMENREITKLKAELELARLNLQNVESELEIKNMTISQLNKKLLTTQNMAKNTQEEKSTMADLLNDIKTAIEDESLTFTNPATAAKFAKKFNQHCHEFPLSSLRLPPTRSSETYINTSTLSIKTSPGRPEPKTNVLERTPQVMNTESTGRKDRANFHSNDFSHSKNMSFQSKRGDLNLEDSRDFLTKRQQSSISSTKSVTSTASRYDEVKSFLQNTDRNTMDFLASLEKFQKDNEKLKREAKELLTKS